MSHRLALIAICATGLLLAACGDRSDQEGTLATETDAPIIEETSPEVLTDATDITEAFYAFLEDAFEERLMDSPEFLTVLSRQERYDEWNDYSDNAVLENLARNERHLRELQTRFDIDVLPSAAQTSYRVFEETLGQRIARADFNMNQYPVTHRGSPASRVNVFLINRHHVNNLEEAEAYIARLNGIESVLGDVSERILARVEYGLHAPAFMYADIIVETQGLAAMAAEEMIETHPVMIDFSEKVGALDLDEATRDRLLGEAREALIGTVARGYAFYIATLEEAQSHTTTDDGIWRHPRGPEDYASRIRARFGRDISPEEIHEFGLSEVARIQDEMRAIMAEVGFEGTLQEFFTYVNEAPQFVYPDTDEGRARHMAEMNAAMDRAIQLTPRQFNLLPEAAVEVRRVEPFRENQAGRAFYSRPAPDGSSPGIFYANQRSMELWRTWHVDTLVFHEAVPGHHFQIALAQELEDTPSIQRYAFNSAYGEGWALYAERLSYELGLFSDPYANFGRLNGELFRAIRLVVDTGLHHYQWSRQQAMDYMNENSALPEAVVEEEIRRYLVWPTQALGYKMGMEEFLRHRARAREALGEAFDIRAFHDVAIGSGPVPLPVLEQLMQAYIEENRPAAAATPTKPQSP